MRKPLASRIAGLAFIYCLVFFILVILQFSNKGNFSLSVGEMNLKGRFMQDTQAALMAEINQASESDLQAIAGGVIIYYGGLDFNLKAERGKGLTLAGADETIAVNPDFLLLKENSAKFIFPGGTALIFYSIDSSRGQELQINAEFPENINSITIPIIPRRASLVQEEGQLGVMHGGIKYLFSSKDHEIDNGYITLSRGRAFVSYRSRGIQPEFNPADFETAHSQNYANFLSGWRDTSFTQWNRSPSLLQNEDDITAFLSETLARGGSYTSAAAAIPRSFVNSARQSYRSAGFLGGMGNAYRSLTAYENDKLSLITRLARERSPEILKEEHLLNFLFTRSNTALANDVMEIIDELEEEMLIIDYCPGLLEAVSDLRRWRPAIHNPYEHLVIKAISVISEHLVRDTENDLVFVSTGETVNNDFNLRLGKTVIDWAENANNTEWEAIGKSLAASALSNAGTGSGKLYNMLGPSSYNPKAVWLSDTGQWAWTVSPSVRATTTDGNLNIAVTFPATMTHYIVIRGIRPFLRLQIHGMDWRTDSQFELYDASGWTYYQQDQTLILKLRHRESVENIRIIYREAASPPPPTPPAPPPPPPPPPPAAPPPQVIQETPTPSPTPSPSPYHAYY